MQHADSNKALSHSHTQIRLENGGGSNQNHIPKSKYVSKASLIILALLQAPKHWVLTGVQNRMLEKIGSLLSQPVLEFFPHWLYWKSIPKTLPSVLALSSFLLTATP